MAAITLKDLARTDLDPVLVTLCDSSTVCVQHRKPKRRVGRYLEHGRTVRLDHGITDDLLHGVCLAYAKGRIVKIEEISIRQGYCLDDANKTRWPLIGRELHRVSQGRDTRSRGGHTVNVVDAADIDDAGTLGDQGSIEVDAGGLVNDNRRRWPWLGRHNV